jgi:hypothetical protein
MVRCVLVLRRCDVAFLPSLLVDLAFCVSMHELLCMFLMRGRTASLRCTGLLRAYSVVLLCVLLSVLLLRSSYIRACEMLFCCTPVVPLLIRCKRRAGVLHRLPYADEWLEPLVPCAVFRLVTLMGG